MPSVNEIIRDHELSAEWVHNGACTEFWSLYRRIAKEYFPKQPICYFRCERLPIKMLVRYNGTNGVSAQHDFTLNSSRLTSSNLEIAGAILHCQVHIWQHCNGKKSACGVHNREFLDKAMKVGVSCGEYRGCTVQACSDQFKRFVSRLFDDIDAPWQPAPVVAPLRKQSMAKWMCKCTSTYAARGVKLSCVCTLFNSEFLRCDTPSP